MFDLYVWLIFEQLLAGRNIMFVVVDAKDAGLFEVWSDGGEGSSSGSSDIQHVLDLLFGLVPEADLTVGGSRSMAEVLGEELRVDVGIDSCGYVAND